MPEPFPFPPGTYKHKKRQIAQILWTIHLDGPFEDPEGRATSLLNAALRVRGLYAPEFDYIRRDINGKRTYKIELAVDPTKVPFPDNPFRGANRKPKPTAVKEDLVLNPPPEPDLEVDPIDKLKAVQRGADADAIAEAVVPEAITPEIVYDSPVMADGSAQDCILIAMSMLNQATLKIATQPIHDVRSVIGTEVAEMRRLVEENSQLHRRVRELEDEKLAVLQSNAALDATVHTLQKALASAGA
jgi:hypothetical protein